MIRPYISCDPTYILREESGLVASSCGRPLRFWGLEAAEAAALQWTSCGGYWHPEIVEEAI
tara:strand:+ start:7079 stop:7261 length:183 start_codon:yes stop_codon:yes gene_type:complete